MRALVVEDDVTSRKLMGSFISKFGDCDSVEDGIEAIVSYRMAICQNKPYDIICLDLNLPDVDGMTVLKKIRWYEKNNDVNESERTKIIVTTSTSEIEIVKKAAVLGCDGYLLKPVDRLKLIEHLRSFGLLTEKNTNF
ncbi:response regulator [bacterium]|nr:response regulator [bacterium]